MDQLNTLILAIFGSIMSSAGLWALLNKMTDRKGANAILLRGLARDRIIFLGSQYIIRGHITKDEYDDYLHYFVDPYFKVGGNGLAERLVEDVKKLPVEYRQPTTNELAMTGEPVE